jgi:hypothetical protein
VTVQRIDDIKLDSEGPGLLEKPANAVEVFVAGKDSETHW